MRTTEVQLARMLVLAFVVGWMNMSTVSGEVGSSQRQFAKNAKKFDVKGDGETDDTVAAQALLNSGASSVFFPDGVYLLGTLTVPAETEVRFAPRAVFKINPARIKDKKLIVLRGDRITLDGITFDFTAPNGKQIDAQKLKCLIYGEGVRHVRITRLCALKRKKAPKGYATDVVRLEHCRNIEIDHCRIANLHSLINTTFCQNLSVHENRAESSQYITLFGTGSEWLRHYANWSSHVVFQCQWWGGDGNDTHAWVPDGTARVVHRGSKPGDPGYNANTAGVYDVSVQNNYAEYGTCLAWGSKGRNVLFDGNVARFMDDMAYDTEGCENVVFSNNIAINSKCCGIGCYFWSEKVLITGNLVMILDDGDDRYKGGFVRLHCPGEDPDHFGVGQALIEGNLFVSELKGKLPTVNIEACRDVTITGNKFTNGRITTCNNSRHVTIVNNDFVCNVPGNYSCIIIRPGGALQDIIRGNTFRRQTNENAPGASHVAIFTIGDNFNYPVLHLIETNFIDGWRHSITCVSRARNKKPRFVLRNNSISGKITLIGSPASYKKLVEGNLSVTSLNPVTAECATKETP